MSTCPDNPYNATSSHVSPCEGAIDPMGGAEIPTGYTAVELFVDSAVEWETDPLAPGLNIPTLLLNQANGGIHIQEGLYLAIE